MSLRSKFEAAGQSHLYQFAKTEQEVASLEQELQDIDPVRVAKLLAASRAAAEDIAGSIAPITKVATVEGTKAERSGWFQAGLRTIANNKVAAVLMAGGQGTRLGSSDPKGMYDIQLPSHSSLFRIQAERILRLRKLSGGSLPWYIMTSSFTHAQTLQFLQENHYFGLPPSDVVLFQQGTLPCVSFDGKILLDSATTVSRAPDGNGGLYNALKDHGIIADMKARGIEWIHVYGVDSATVLVADPTFVGYCIAQNACAAAKVVEKTRPDEAVGMLCTRAGRVCVVEYSEMPKELCEKRDEATGRLLMSAGNIANHMFNLEFLSLCADKWSTGDVPFHIATKKIPTLGPDGQRFTPAQPNGIKLESFVFDVFPLADPERMAVFEIDRNIEFAPVKNAPGSAVDSPDTARGLVAKQSRWLIELAGGKFETEGEGMVEVSPLVSFDEHDLTDLSARVQGKTFSSYPVLIN
eukprot:TRINITY_DN2183_c0_g1_i1.p1 TRINITY_DN2183_c0_g1~~TRINITY_DN2183_c0_g1_i1.p1  ORF type:complete len:466 (-),score=123.87 TRINITY_DN2183_c0_g1_i1:68-1465(-)